MDVKELNKTQLILLAVLLSFLTSIVTGITTVALMNQAPTSITAPLNHVVEQTVQKIVQVEGQPSVQNNQTTVVIKEEDLVVDAIAKNQSAIFTITAATLDPENNPIEVPAGRGFVVSSDGVIVADAALVSSSGTYYVKNNSGKFATTFLGTDKTGISFLRIGAAVNGIDKPVFTVPDFGDLTKMKEGQEIIFLATSPSSFIFDGDENLKMSVNKSNAGSMVLDLDGNVLGIALSGPDNSFTPMNVITNALQSFDTLPTTPVTPPSSTTSTSATSATSGT